MNKKPAHIDSRRAFTLVELLLVLVLVAVSVAAVVPRFRGTLGAWQLKEAARNLEATLHLASQWARVRQEVVVFALDAGKGVFTMRPLRKDGQPVPGAFPPIGRQSLGRSVQVVRMEGLQNMDAEKVLLFWPDGTSQAAVIELTGGRADAGHDVVWQIALDGQGAVRCQERSVDDKSP